MKILHIAECAGGVERYHPDAPATIRNERVETVLYMFKEL